jgi:hypothetical protein
MEKNIMAVIASIASSKEEIHLLNTYKGVPLIYSAQILDVGSSSIRVFTDTCQTVSMCLEKRTYLQSPKLQDILRADVQFYNNNEMVTTLGNISRVNFGIGNRTAIRVHPTDALAIHLRDKSGFCTVTGKIYDISQAGIGLFVAWKPSIPRFFFPGSPVAVRFQLPGVYSNTQTRPLAAQESEPLDRFATERTRFTTTSGREVHTGFSGRDVSNGGEVINPGIDSLAEVANIYQDDAMNHFRIGLRVTHNPAQEKFLMSYISQRQSEIIQEIRERYQSIRQGRAIFNFP